MIGLGSDKNGCSISRKRIFGKSCDQKYDIPHARSRIYVCWAWGCQVVSSFGHHLLYLVGLLKCWKGGIPWRTTDVKSLKLTMSVFAIAISNIRKLPWRNQTLDKKEEQTKSKDWRKESCKPGKGGRQSEAGWEEEATPGHEEERWSLQGQLVSSIILIHVVRILWM